MKRRIRFGSFLMAAMTLLLVIATPYARHYVETRRCAKRLAAITQAARVWADARDGCLPGGFGLMSNELASPHLLICPGDKSRDPADNWQALNSANSSYQISEGVLGTKDLPPEIGQHIIYLRCKVHGGNYANALGKVSVNSLPMPPGVYILAGLAIIVFLGKRLWHHYKHVQGQLQGGTSAGDLLPRIEQVRHDYLAARRMAPNPWHRKGLIAAARHAVRSLPFFRDRKGDPQAHEHPSTT